MKLFITGGTGFIGTEVIQQALSAGHEVSVLTRSQSSERVAKNLGATAVLGDLLCDGLWQKSVAKSDWVLHLAQPQTFGGRITQKRANNYQELRLEMDRRLLESVSSKTKRILYVGGTSYYGDVGPKKVSENTIPNPKGWGPFLAPAIDALSNYKNRGLPIIEAYPGYVYGLGSWFTQYILFPVKRKKTLTLLSGHNAIISPIHYQDCARALLLLLEQGKTGTRYFVVDNTPIANEMLFRYTAYHLGCELKIRRVPIWACSFVLGRLATDSLLSNCALSNQKLRNLGFTPKFPSVQEGIPEVIRSL